MPTTDLMAGDMRYYRVFANYGDGTEPTLSTVSNMVSASTAAPERAPAVGSVSATGGPGGSVAQEKMIEVTWVLVPDDDVPAGTTIQGYLIQVPVKAPVARGLALIPTMRICRLRQGTTVTLNSRHHTLTTCPSGWRNAILSRFRGQPRAGNGYDSGVARGQTMVATPR